MILESQPLTVGTILPMTQYTPIQTAITVRPCIVLEWSRPHSCIRRLSNCRTRQRHRITQCLSYMLSGVQKLRLMDTIVLYSSGDNGWDLNFSSTTCFPGLSSYVIENGNLCLDSNGTWALRAYLALFITLSHRKSDVDWSDLQSK